MCEDFVTPGFVGRAVKAVLENIENDKVAQ